MIASMKASYARGEQALQTAKKLQAEARAAIEATRASARKAFEQDAGNTGFLAPFGRALGGAGGAGGISPGTAQANRLSRAADSSEEHTSELQSLLRISYDVLCLQTK